MSIFLPLVSWTMRVTSLGRAFHTVTLVSCAECGVLSLLQANAAAAPPRTSSPAWIDTARRGFIDQAPLPSGARGAAGGDTDALLPRERRLKRSPRPRMSAGTRKIVP